MGGDRRFPVMYTGTGDYRVRIKDADGLILADIDGIEGAVTVTGGGGGGGTTIPTGFYMDAATSQAEAGWVRANGRTIGNAASNATERANADCQALYVKLWNENSPTYAVAGGRGASGLADFNAGKQLTLPDRRGRTSVGASAMGNADSGLLDIISFTAGSKNAVGSFAGVAAAALTLGQLPLHNHTATTGLAGGHGHPGSISDVILDHSHLYSTFINGGNVVVQAGAGQSVSGPLTPTQPSTLGGGNHQHTLTITSVGDHTHTVTVTNSGNSDWVSFMQPSVISFVFIKL